MKCVELFMTGIVFPIVKSTSDISLVTVDPISNFLTMASIGNLNLNLNLEGEDEI